LPKLGEKSSEAVISKVTPISTKTEEKKNTEEIITPAQILDNLIAVAIDNRASDVHFEPEREGFGVRFRIDGILHPIETINTNIQEKVISRIKVLSQMDIIEHRLPKDGHFEFPHGNTIYNIRVSTMPEVYGESIVFRIHGIHEVVHKIEELGLEPEQFILFKALIKSPSGMILITGPTGSGKTDLIYSILRDLSSEEKNIITIEEPVEYQLENIRQTSVNDDLGLSFVVAMRSVLRQDPDVLMLGEIRDGETALLAIQASLSGILLFSTFHTFDLPALVNRLVEMNISRTIVAQSLRGVMSVRLVRKICEGCKETIVLTEEQKRLLPPEMVNDVFYHGRGCDICHNLGYSDRIGVFEIIEIDDEIRASLSDSEPSANILALLKKKNIMSLRLAAFEKARRGITTIDEVLRVVGYLKE
jgi:type II secretory ATPase GspE/PulE/Tfp pilus assembly ATPase PilB-like protein